METKKTRNFKTGNISDVYEMLKTRLSEDFNLLGWFLENHKSISEKPTIIDSDKEYYHGGHAHTEWDISISRIDTPWGRCYKIVEDFYDSASYSYDSKREINETIILFAE
jgi:hypothetical protein